MAVAGRHMIAIVDDDDAVRESLCFLLSIAGHDVVDYPSGQSFLDGCDLPHVSGIILDQHMPQMTGLELVARLRAEGQSLPILLVTGSPSPELSARAAALGVERVLDKPPSEQQLMAFVDGLRG